MFGHLESVGTLAPSYETGYGWRYEHHVAELKSAYVLDLRCKHGIKFELFSRHVVKQAHV